MIDAIIDGKMIEFKTSDHSQGTQLLEYIEHSAPSVQLALHKRNVSPSATYRPHQGAKEKARRMKQLAAARDRAYNEYKRSLVQRDNDLMDEIEAMSGGEPI